MNLKQGDKAPDFTASDQNGQTRILSDYQGHWLLLYFYPKDFTSGCTKEACSLRDNFGELKKHAQVVGVSTDSVESHKKFEAKYSLPFTLLADPERVLVDAYHANGLLFPKRVSFLIDPQGIIRKIYKPVNPTTHAQDVLDDLLELVGK